MARTFYFVSGLPRAGSTLLCNLLAQNPLFHVSKATSGCCDIVMQVRKNWDQVIEHKAERSPIDTPDRQKRVMRGTLEAYHDAPEGIDHIVDKSRGWIGHIESLQFMGIEPKILVPVRDIAEVLGSFEKLYREQRGQVEWAVEKTNYFQAITTLGRATVLTNEAGPVGIAFNRIKDAFQKGQQKYLHLVEMDDLTQCPKETMQLVYKFLGLPDFAHNFDKVEQYTQEDDFFVHRIKDLHTIRSKVEPVPKRGRQILGREAFKQFRGKEFWRKWRP